MTYEEAVAAAILQGGYVKDILPRANWLEIHGMFTPEQLRAFADEIERRFNHRRTKP